jgi:hypothetical protein
MLRGRQSSNLTMCAPWCITGCPSNIFYQTTSKGQARGAAKALFCRNIMEACEASKYGSDSKQNHQVEGAIMQAKEWTRTFGRCNPWSTRSQINKAKMSALEKNWARRSKEAPKPVGPGRPAYPLQKHPGAPLRQVSLSSRSLFVCSCL